MRFFLNEKTTKEGEIEIRRWLFCCFHGNLSGMRWGSEKWDHFFSFSFFCKLPDFFFFFLPLSITSSDNDLTMISPWYLHDISMISPWLHPWSHHVGFHPLLSCLVFAFLPFLPLFFTMLVNKLMRILLFPLLNCDLWNWAGFPSNSIIFPLPCPSPRPLGGTEQ